MITLQKNSLYQILDLQIKGQTLQHVLISFFLIQPLNHKVFTMQTKITSLSLSQNIFWYVCFSLVLFTGNSTLYIHKQDCINSIYGINTYMTEKCHYFQGHTIWCIMHLLYLKNSTFIFQKISELQILQQLSIYLTEQDNLKMTYDNPYLTKHSSASMFRRLPL